MLMLFVCFVIAHKKLCVSVYMCVCVYVYLSESTDIVCVYVCLYEYVDSDIC